MLDEETKGLETTDDLNINTDDIPPEDKPEDKTEDKTDNSAPENNDDENKGESDIYGSPETYDYSEIQLPEGMKLDEEMVGEFDVIAKKFNLSNDSANELMNLAVKLSEKNTAGIKDLAVHLQQAEKDSYLQMLNDDKELDATNEEKYNPYLTIASKGVKAFATQGFMDFIKQKGLCYHPEFIKTFHKIGLLCTDDKLPEGNNPVGTKERPADVLYGNPAE